MEIHLTTTEQRLAKSFARFFRSNLALTYRPNFPYHHSRRPFLTFSLQQLYALYYRTTPEPVSFPTFTQHFRYFLQTTDNKRFRALYQKDYTNVWWYGARMKTFHERESDRKRREKVVAKLRARLSHQRSEEEKAHMRYSKEERNRHVKAWFLDQLVVAPGVRTPFDLLKQACQKTKIIRVTPQMDWFFDLLRTVIDRGEFLRENIFVMWPYLYGAAPGDKGVRLRQLLGSSEGTPVPDDSYDSP